MWLSSRWCRRRGVGATLRHAGIENFLILDRSTVGAFSIVAARDTFYNASFPTNSIGMLDLNAVALEPRQRCHFEQNTLRAAVTPST